MPDSSDLVRTLGAPILRHLQGAARLAVPWAAASAFVDAMTEATAGRVRPS